MPRLFRGPIANFIVSVVHGEETSPYSWRKLVNFRDIEFAMFLLLGLH